MIIVVIFVFLEIILASNESECCSNGSICELNWDYESKISLSLLNKLKNCGWNKGNKE